MMLLWDIKFLKKLSQLGIEPDLYKRYVDDLIMILDVIKNMKYCPRSDAMVPTDENDNMNDPDDVYTFETLVMIANSLKPTIQMEFDTPNKSPEKKMPVLDLLV